jgi:hypothetical protein
LDVDRSGSNIWHAGTSGGTTVLAKVLSTCSAAPTNRDEPLAVWQVGGFGPGDMMNTLWVAIVVWIVELGAQNTPLPSNSAV